ncbi:MAG: peptidoglycan DD-metalloendopeptidase family protein [bacterium]
MLELKNWRIGKFKIFFLVFLSLMLVLVAFKVLVRPPQDQDTSLSPAERQEGSSTLGREEVKLSEPANYGRDSFLGTKKAEKKDADNDLNQSSNRVNQNQSEAQAKNLLEVKTHVVKPGATLWSIAKEHGLHLSTVVHANNLSPSQPIHPGQKLKIYNMDGFIYRVPRGQTLSRIARTYDVSLHEIMQINQIENPHLIPAGQKIFVPAIKPLYTFIWPARGRISSGFGWRRNPFTKKGREYHRGIDIAVNTGTPIRASHSGRVVVAYRGKRWNKGYGKLVVIRGGDNSYTYYAHLSRVLVKRGQYVRQGQKIGLSGNTGRSTGPHLFFAIVKNGKARNPLKYLSW